jgi:hypothetical protein
MWDENKQNTVFMTGYEIILIELTYQYDYLLTSYVYKDYIQL